jgi:hypothetical protein
VRPKPRGRVYADRRNRSFPEGSPRRGASCRTVWRPSDDVVDGLSVTGGISRLRTSSITASASHPVFAFALGAPCRIIADGRAMMAVVS